MRIRLFRRLGQERHGSVAVLVAVAIVPLIAMIGIATDTARGYLAKSRLSSAVDAGALAGARVFFQDRRDADVKKFFDANFPDGYMGGTVTEPTITADENAGVLTVSAQATVPTTFMRIFGNETMTISASAEVTRESKPLHVVLAVDMSGSMTRWLNGQRRIDHAKEAARKLIDILYGDASQKDLLKIGVVPWAGAVNVTRDGTTFGYNEYGNQLSDVDRVRNEGVPNFINQHWSGNGGSGNFHPQDPYQTHKAVNGGNNQSQVYYAHNSPVPLLSEPIFRPNTNNPKEVWSGCVWARWEQPHVLPNGQTADRTSGLTNDWPGWEPMGADTLPVPGNDECPATLYASRNEECTPCPANGITPMSGERTVAETAVNNLTIPNTAWDTDYYTNIPQGLVWGWRAVDPQVPFTEGADFQQGYEPERAIVLLTDGENTWRAGDAYNRGMPNRQQRDDRLLDIAAAAKAAGIHIYTIQFANSSGDLAQLMKDVATEPNAPYYYNAPSGAELEDAFQEVANHLSNLRISR